MRYLFIILLLTAGVLVYFNHTHEQHVQGVVVSKGVFQPFGFYYPLGIDTTFDGTADLVAQGHVQEPGECVEITYRPFDRVTYALGLPFENIRR